MIKTPCAYGVIKHCADFFIFENMIFNKLSCCTDNDSLANAQRFIHRKRCTQAEKIQPHIKHIWFFAATKAKRA